MKNQNSAGKKKKKKAQAIFDNIQTALAFGILKITELGL